MVAPKGRNELVAAEDAVELLVARSAATLSGDCCDDAGGAGL